LKQNKNEIATIPFAKQQAFSALRPDAKCLPFASACRNVLEQGY